MKYQLNKLIRVDVTRDDIDNGIRNKSTCCPIALAVCRVLDSSSEDGYIEVDGDISILSEGLDVTAICPHGMNITKFIIAFDKEELVLPFTFMIEITESEYDEDDEPDYDYLGDK